MAVKSIIDFRGGYTTDIPSELMTENELTLAENCNWRNGVTKRNGITRYSYTDFAGTSGIKGGIRAYFNSTWYTILALDDGSNVHFYYGTADSFTEIDATYLFTTGTNVEFAELQGHVVAVNGTDKPAVIYWDSALVIEDLEAYDERLRDPANWYAGQWEDSLVVGYQECGLSEKTSATATGLTASSYGYQECGLSGKDTTTATGLATTHTYYFKVNIDGAGVEEYSITTGASVLFSNIITLLNAELSGASFAISGGDLRCTSALLGTGSSIALSAGTTGDDLFAALTDFSDFDEAVAGATQTYYYKVNIDGTGEVEYMITVGTDATYGAVIILMNTNHEAAYFSIVGGDLRCTSYLVGATSAIALGAGTTGTDLFATLTGFSAFDTASAGEAGTHYVDDTTDAQDDYDEDYQLANTEANDGCYVACDFTFNKIVFKRAVAAGGSPVMEVCYWNGTEWTSVGTLVTTPTWTDATGDKELEFDIPFDSDGNILWEPYAEDDTEDSVINRFVIRIRFTTAPSAAFSCTKLEVRNTQYLSEILQNERPHLVVSHNQQIYLASNNIVNFSPPNHVTGWREGQSEYFIEGGPKITGLASFADTLVVGKKNTIYTWTTSDLLDPIRSRPLTTVGPLAPRSMRQVGNIICFVAADGMYAWDGSIVTKISKHINTDIESWTLANACAVTYKGEYWVSFPTNSVTLTFDPDTFRIDDAGDGRVSMFKYTGYKVHQFLNCNGDGDTGYLLGIVDQAEPYMVRCDSGAQDNLTGTATNIDMKVRTKYFSFGGFEARKKFGILKIKVKEVTAHSGERHKITFRADDNDEYFQHVMVVPKGTTTYSEELHMPHNTDGKSLAIELRHNGPTSATLIGYALDVVERSF